MNSEIIKLLIYMFMTGGLAYFVTPYIIKLAITIGAVDVPTDNRRVHKIPIPRLGGLAIYIAFISMFLFTTKMSSIKNFGIITSSLIIIGCGLFDDLKPMSAKKKLLFQILAATVLYFSGFKIEFLTNFFDGFISTYFASADYIYISSALISYPITIFWIVGITNTINLIDGLDGLAAGISFIASIAITYVAFINGRFEVAALTIILAGSILGFLPFNFNPAKVFMGDTGSLFLGLILSIASIEGALKSTTVFTLFVPVVILGIPIFDTSFAIIRRILSGKSIAEADKGHLHHRLLFIGMNQKKAVLSLYFIASLFGLSAVLIVKSQMIYSLLVFLLACILIFIPINKAPMENEKEMRSNVNE
ncbi:MraY family glycosyltransferase [Helicovermis profundi]|uniref:MraY family glycosyltransferase n=1 Tax=Helicovermis profundi TaxID=3065157 RepID=A0AAU9EBP1_9FIRM|nr:MraY family glycosyltransferase [Clostridia bacterium S502]